MFQKPSFRGMVMVLVLVLEMVVTVVVVVVQGSNREQ
jgi:hypothetical protein